MESPSLILSIARRSLDAHLDGAVYRPTADDRTRCEKAYEPAQGAFVTIWSGRGSQKELRGCIGRHSRTHDSIADEVAELAVASASEDPRFPAVDPSERPRLSLEVSLLGELEPIESKSLLDPRRFGVYVKSGHRAATLLPGIEGIDSIDEQLSAVTRKAGIRPGDPVKMWRYPVRKFAEESGE
jgi:AmmeMemoRadiSam system protein A